MGKRTRCVMANKKILLVTGIVFGSFLLVNISKYILSPSTVLAFSENQSHGISVDVAETVIDKSMSSECGITGNYPEKIMQWCSLITEHAVNQGLEPNLIAALVLQESGGDPDAYSKSGAVGLMQVMPRDGLAAEFMCPNGPCFSNRPSMAELYDPVFNIDYGTRFLAGLMNRYNGDIREALKFYGPADVGYYYADIVVNIYNGY